MSDVFLPTCDIPVGEAGLPCKRWPGHLGACIDENGAAAYIPPLFDPADYSAPPEFPDFDKLFTQGSIILGTMLVMMLFSVVTCIYLLVR